MAKTLSLSHQWKMAQVIINKQNDQEKQKQREKIEKRLPRKASIIWM